MRVSAPFRRVRQEKVAHATIAKQSQYRAPPGSRPACICAATAALALVFCAASFNAGHAYELGLHHSPFRAIVLATASIAAAVMAPLCIMAAMRGKGFGTRLLALVLALGCILYTSVSSLGFVAGARDLGVSGHAAAVEAHQDRRALIEAARKELTGLKGQSTAVIERRSELTALLVELGKASLATTGTKADPQAAAVAYYATAAGYPVTAEQVAPWLNLGMVLMLELFAACGLTVAASLRPASRWSHGNGVRTIEARQTAPDAPKPPGGRVRPSAGSTEDDDDQPPEPRRGKGGRPVAILPEAAVAKLRKADGRAGSIRGAAKILGTSKSTAHRVLHQLAGLGMIQLRTTPARCSVALA